MQALILRSTLRSSRTAAAPAAAAVSTYTRHSLHTTTPRWREGGEPTTDTLGAMPDALGDKRFKGRTGGGEALDSSSDNAPPKPKISNLSVPGSRDEEDALTEEQKKEVDEHNKEFDRKHDRSPSAPGDKVDKDFWRGDHEGSRTSGKGQ